jgi:hypothetical protein
MCHWRLGILSVLLIARGVYGCDCPPTAASRNIVVAVPARGAASGLVVCGDKESEQSGSITASNFEVFNCGARQPILQFDAVMTARLESRRGQLKVLEVSRWPFGKEWQWVDVPVLEWLLQPGDRTAPSARLVAPRPAVSAVQVKAFLEEYRQILSARRAADEEVVAKLFTAAMTGNEEAAMLFRTMREDAQLDGAAGETYSYAQETFDKRWDRERRGMD